MITVERESVDLYENTGVYERCVICKSATAYWHKESNTPCCQSCAEVNNLNQLNDARHHYYNSLLSRGS